MAEFALGLTKTAVEGTLSRVKLAIEEETKLRVRVENDLVFITGEFQMMQSFLNVASKERANNEVVRTWVKQVRNLAFDVEDCVEFVVHLENKSTWGWLRRLWHTVYCRAPPLPLDVAVAEIKQLKARVEDVSLRNTRYNLISDSGSSSKGILLPEEPTASGPSAFHILREVWEAAGKLRGMVDLQELIARESRDLQVFSVWGSTGGDLGTASIFREVYNDPKICKEFECRAWVKLKHPFHPDEFLESLFTQFYPSYHQSKVGTDDLMKARLKQHVNKRRYLVILEEVSTVIEWEAIKMCLPDSKNGSRIIISTQHLGTALLCTGEPNLVSELRRFSDGQSLCVFFRKISGCRSDMGELKWHARGRRGVFSVCGSRQRTSVMVRKLFRSIVEKKEEFDGLAFQTYRWVRMVHPFDLKDFSRRLFLDLSSWDLEFDYFDHQNMSDYLFIRDDDRGDLKPRLKAFLKMEETDLIEGCRKLMREEDCLVAINYLESTDDWDLIKSTFLSDTETKGCIVVITQGKRVANHCVGNNEDRILQINEMEADAAEGRVFSSGREEAYELINNFEVIGHQDEGYRLTELIDDPGVVSAWGIAGVGKSAVIRNIYCHRLLGLGPRYKLAHSSTGFAHRKMFMKYSWVDVPHPFNLTDFSQRLLLDFHSDDLQAKEAVAVGIVEGQDPIQGCCRLLREHACLVVVDGLRSTHDWDMIKATLLLGPSKSCIVVITNEANVATHCVNHDEEKMVNIKCLEPDESLILFTKIAWGSKQLTKDEMLLSEIILAKCGGLPKVIAAIGEQRDQSNFFAWYTTGYLASYTTDDIIDTMRRLQYLGADFMRRFEHLGDVSVESAGGWMRKVVGQHCLFKSPGDWGRNLEHLGYAFLAMLEYVGDDFMGKLETDQRFHSLRGLFSWMESYFDACSDSLKPCIFYLSVFPVGHNIRWKRLLRRWIAEGFSRDKSGSTAEEDGEMLFSELINLSIIQLQYRSSNVCQVNGFFREYIISRTMEDNLVFALEGCCILNSQLSGQHLTIRSNWDRDQILFESIDFSRLRSLTVFGEWRPFFISPNVEMRLLRVLDLENTSGVTDSDLERIGKAFSRLKFLSVRGCKEISRVPKSLGGLRQLQTLDVRGTSVAALPSVIMKLEKLQYIRAGTIVPSHQDWTSAPQENIDDTYEICKSTHLEGMTSDLPADVDVDEDTDTDTDTDTDELQTSTPLEGRDGMSISLPAATDEIQESTPLEGLDGMPISLPAATDEIQESTPLEGRDGMSIRLPAATDEIQESTPLESRDSMSISLPAATDEIQESTPLEGMTTGLPADTDELQTSTPLEGLDGMPISLPAATDEIQESTPLEGRDGMSIILPAATDEIQESTPLESRDSMSISLPAATDEIQESTPLEGMTTGLPADTDELQTSTPLEGLVGMTISLPAAAHEIPTSTPLEGQDGTNASLPTTSHEKSTWSRPRALVSLLSKVRGRQLDSGVEISAGIAKLMALHTLGVVNVSGVEGKVILKELEMLTQLRKLRLSGINTGNIKELCSVISGHRHLESLSLRMDKDKKGIFPSLDGFSQPPRTLKSLKLYGHVHGLPVWMKQFDNLRKLDLEMTILTQDDLYVLDELPRRNILRRLCIKPTIQDGQLRFHKRKQFPISFEDTLNLRVLKIDCSSSLQIAFGKWITMGVELLIVHCSRGSCLRISGLDKLYCLKEVWLKGCYDNKTKKDLQSQIDRWHSEEKKPVLMLEKPPSS